MNIEHQFMTAMADWTARLMTPPRRRDEDEVELTPDQARFLGIFNAYTEITSCTDALLDIRVYISRFPFTRSRVTPARYLAQQIGSYLNEVYILRLRLINFARTVKDSYRDTPHKLHVSSAMTPVFSLVTKTFEGINTTRGTHVHEQRYSDRELHILNFYDPLRQTGNHEFDEDYKFDYKLTRNRWKRRIDDNQATIQKLLEIYYRSSYDALFATGAPLDVTTMPPRPVRPSGKTP